MRETQKISMVFKSGFCIASGIIRVFAGVAIFVVVPVPASTSTSVEVPAAVTPVCAVVPAGKSVEAVEGCDIATSRRWLVKQKLHSNLRGSVVTGNKQLQRKATAETTEHDKTSV